MLRNLCNNSSKFDNKKFKRINVIMGLASILATSCGTLTAYAEEWTHEVRVVIDGKWHVYNTKDMQISDFLKENKIELNEKDIVDTDIETIIDKDMVIYIDKAETIKFVIDGEEEVPYTTSADSIGVAIQDFNKETGRNISLNNGQSPANKVTQNMLVNVSSLKEEIKKTQEPIPFETETVKNDDLLEGKTNVKTEGVDGIKEITTKEIYKDGELNSKEIIDEKIIKEPITKVVEEGTKKFVEPETTPVPVQIVNDDKQAVAKRPSVQKSVKEVNNNTVKTEDGIYTVNKKINMKSTAYTAPPGKNTASGRKAQRGVVAVDTNVIPFGTELYIEGYGYAIAGDTGGAIKGNKIDLFFDTYEECMRHGVRNLNVYILGEKVS